MKQKADALTAGVVTQPPARSSSQLDEKFRARAPPAAAAQRFLAQLDGRMIDAGGVVDSKSGEQVLRHDDSLDVGIVSIIC